MELWCLQAEATLSFMAEKEKTLKDLSLTLPFFLLEVRVRANRYSISQVSSARGRRRSIGFDSVAAGCCPVLCFGCGLLR